MRRRAERRERRDTDAPSWLYPGLALLVLLAVVAFVSVRREWLRRIEQARAAAVYELVAARAPLRPTDTPGLSAWLAAELRRFARRDPSRDTTEVPDAAHRVRAAFVERSPTPTPPGPKIPPETPPEVLDARALDPSADEDQLLFRRQRFVRRGDEILVSAEPRASIESAEFLAVAGDRLIRSREALERGAPIPRDGVDLVRLYAVSREGSLLSLPWSEARSDAGERRAALLAEGAEFRKFPRLPNFVPFEAVFRFDFARPGAAPGGEADEWLWTGAYLDLGGRGIVGTLLVPFEESGVRAVLAADFRFDIDWAAFARGLERPLVGATVELARTAPARWRPWRAIAAALADAERVDGSGGLRAAVRGLAESDADEEPSFLVHGVADSGDAVAALQVTETQWLIVLFPRARSAVALVPVVIVGLLGVALLAGFEVSRREAEKARRKAEREWREKQNLLDSMQVPLTVVDPNTDRIVHANRAARELGIAAGTRFADLVAPEGRERYARMQRFDGPRRAYGTPLELRDPADPSAPARERYAVVRSVAVTAPIESLDADERHRLGVLFVVDPEDDLGPLLAEAAEAARADERRRLAGLLSHGVDTMARVLAGVAARSGGDALGERGERRERQEETGARRETAEFVTWLAEYLERRVRTVGFLLEHWSLAEALPGETAIDGHAARATLERLRAVFALVREDAGLRSRLLWSNGTLAERAPDGEVLRAELDWPAGLVIACPQPGGFGFFVGEALTNAVRHGAPGTVPRIAIRHDAVRRELRFTVENRIAPSAAREAAGATYGGRALLERLAVLFGWRDLRWSREDGVYRLEWSVPAAHLLAPDQAD